MGIFIDGHEVKLPGDKLALRVTAVKQDDGTEINPATSEDIAALARPVRVAGPTKLTATTVSQTFAQMGLTLNAATVRLRISISSPLRYAWGPVSASSQLLQADIYEETGNQVTGSPADLRTLQFACDVGEVEIWVTEYIS